jgi:hypothetical protein
MTMSSDYIGLWRRLILFFICIIFDTLALFLKNKGVAMSRRYIITIAVLLIAFGSTWGFSQKPKNESDPEHTYYIVKTQKGVDPEKLRDIFAPHILDEIKLVSGTTYRLKFKEDPGIKELQRLVKQKGGLGIVEPDQKVLMTNPMQ